MDADFIIVGAGLAGLSFAIRLLPILEAERKNLIILDQKQDFPQDKHWCGWQINPHPFEHLIKHQWQQLQTGRYPHLKTHYLTSAYQVIRSGDFYRDCLKKLENHPKVKLILDQKVSHIAANHVIADKYYAGKTVLDATAPKPASIAKNKSALLQCFYGWHIRVDKPVFNPNLVSLMDFSPNQDNGILFNYCLPFSPFEALIEPTYFLHHDQIPSLVKFQTLAESYLESQFGISKYEVLHTESGCLPMFKIAATTAPGVYAIGTGHGLIRPATGYAFDGIQRHQARMIDYYAKHKKLPFIKPYRAHSLWMDNLFLKVLKQHPNRGSEIFCKMFENAPIERIIRFLSDKGTIIDNLSIIRSVPSWPFIKCLVN